MAEAIDASHVPAPVPAVLEPGPLVILREQDLDCDLATAIQRVRSSTETAQSRILIIGPEREAPAPDGPRMLPRFPTTIGQAVRLGERSSLAAVGQRLVPLLDCLERFLAEFGEVVDDLSSHEDLPRARLASRHRTLGEILEWTQAVSRDLRAEAEGAVAGFRMLDLRELLVEAAHRLEVLYPRLRIQVHPGSGGHAYFGRSGDLAEALYLALGLTALRIGGHGTLAVELTARRNDLEVRIRGIGTPIQVEDPESVERLREIAGAHGAQIRPDLGGVDGTGMALILPLGPAGIPD